MPSVIRPTWRGTDEQRKLVNAVSKAIDRDAESHQKTQAAIWEAVRKARDAGVPDTQLCRITGLNRSTLLRKLGPRQEDQTPDSRAKE